MKEEQTDYIYRYFRGELSEEERKEFETRLSQDTEFAQFVADERDIFDAIRLAPKVEKLKNTLSEIQTEPSRPIFFSRRSVIGIAAAILVLVTGIWTVNEWYVAQKYEDLYQTYYSTTSSPTISTRDNQGSLDSVVLYFRQKEYESFIKQVEKKTKYTDEEALMVAYAHLSLNQPSKAISRLSSHAFSTHSTENGEKQMKAYWYSGLAYTKLGKKDKAIEVLSQIEDGYSFSGQARKLLEQLESF